ncbi:MAG: SRPBCC family protein [Bacteroidota bacterium]
MKILKYILFGILGIIVVFLLLGLVTTNDFKIEKSITINAPAEEILPYLANLRLQNEWSIWAKMDPDQTIKYEGEDGTPGSKYTWDGEITGKGSQEVVSISPTRVELNLDFTDPYESHADVYFTLNETTSGTEVSWGFESETPYPMNVFLLFGDMGVGDDFQKGLENLKATIEG